MNEWMNKMIVKDEWMNWWTNIWMNEWMNEQDDSEWMNG